MIKLSIRRPVAVAMGYLAVGLLGVASWRNIPIELLPDTELPRLTVNARWPGASPETVEAFLTSPLEAEVQLVRGVEKVVSDSREAWARISIEFARKTDMDFARLDLSERISRLEETGLPEGIDGVTVSPYVPDEFSQRNRGFLTYTFTGRRTLESLREHLNDVVVPELTQVEGVAVVTAYGGRERVLEIELDRQRMADLNVSAYMVGLKLVDLDLVREAGSVRAGDREWTVTIRNRPGSAQDIREAIVSGQGDRTVRISDIAVVRDTYEESRQHYRINGQPAVRMQVTKKIGANSVRVADAVKERMEVVERRNPPNSRFILDWDESEQIRRQLSDLRNRAAVSVLVIFSVLFLFLRSLRSAIVVFATIAFSILIALNFIYFSGLSLNLLTLMGLAMGFGLIVDNSIVVLENIYRRWQSGRVAVVAVKEGASRVVLPILAATATTLIVLVPFVYLQDDLRVFYVPLAIVVGITILASLLVSFTFIPALVAKLLPAQPSGAPPQTAELPALEGNPKAAPIYERFYRSLVMWAVLRPWAIVIIGLGALGGSYYLFDQYVRSGVTWGGFFGSRDYVQIDIQLPEGSDLVRTDELSRYFEDRLLLMPEVEQFETRVTGERSSTVVTFPDSFENTYVPVDIKDQLFTFSLGFTGAEVRVHGFGPSFYSSEGSPPTYKIQVLGYNYEEVRDIAEDMGTRLEKLPRVRDVNTNAVWSFFGFDRATEFVVTIRRDVVARHDLPVSNLVRQIQSAVRGQVAGRTIKIGGDEIRFDVKLEGNRDIDLQRLRQTLVLTPAGRPIRLGELVDIGPQEVLATIHREDQQYERSVAYEFRGPRRLGNLVHNTIIESTEVPPGYEVKNADLFRWSAEERAQMNLVLAVSIALIYMVTAALFGSFLLPLCVLMTVPMALIGVFLIFFYTNASFTREALIGVIMMGGIVVNNAILLVDHINQVRKDADLGLRAAIVQATVERVRPILMTSATTVLGLLPLVLFSATADANIWNALAYALIGGLLSSTFFILTATPALYYLFDRRKAVA